MALDVEEASAGNVRAQSSVPTFLERRKYFFWHIGDKPKVNLYYRTTKVQNILCFLPIGSDTYGVLLAVPMPQRHEDFRNNFRVFVQKIGIVAAMVAVPEI